MLEALILTSAVVLSLTGYTFWASRKGQDFSFLGPFLFASLSVLVLVGFLQVGIFIFPYGRETKQQKKTNQKSSEGMKPQ